jgi:hypothetical protein
VDPPRNQRTRDYIAEAEQVARILEGADFRVERLYHPQATWDRVRSAAHGADLLVYYGHGNGHGWMGETDPASINGLCLTNPHDPNAIWAGPGVPGGNANDLAGLGLGPNGMVVLVHTCYSAGSSAADREPVDYATAITRVRSYAQAFFRAGAGCYVATNYEGAAPDYFRRWTGGQPSAEAFMEALGGEVTHTGPGLVLAEEYRPNNPCRWVSAWVAKPGDPPRTIKTAQAARESRVAASNAPKTSGRVGQEFAPAVGADSRAQASLCAKRVEGRASQMLHLDPMPLRDHVLVAGRWRRVEGGGRSLLSGYLRRQTGVVLTLEDSQGGGRRIAALPWHDGIAVTGAKKVAPAVEAGASPTHSG